MSTRMPSSSRRALRPSGESLETRQVLSSLSTVPTASVSGTDINGDRWTLTLYGPGTLNVVDADGNAFTRETANLPTEINTITVSGTVTSKSRLVGKVTHVAPGSDGRVFFQNLRVLSTANYGLIDQTTVGPKVTTPQNGIAAVDMPGFWLGHTELTAPSGNSSPVHTSAQIAGEIVAPEGITALRFGGVDATYTPPGGTPLNTTSQSNEFLVNLGTPIHIGTSIIVNKVISDAQVTAATGTATSGTVEQQLVTFLVTGRLNLFQANEIAGNTTPADATTRTPTAVPSQFFDSAPTAPNPTSNQPGGTFVISQGGAAIGNIGNIRIGGNVTNFTAFAITTDVGATPLDTSVDPHISNFFIGGETNNVILVGQGGTRNVFFGRGMDNVKINTLFIQNLQANRGANNSTVTAMRQIGNMVIGGDMINTNIQSGYIQNLASASSTPGTVFSAGGGVFNGAQLPTILNRVQFSQAVNEPLAHGGGQIQGRIAGDVINSVVSVSVDPDPSGITSPGQFENATSRRFPFGAPNNIVLPSGTLKVKVEGTIDNSGIQSGANQIVSPDIPSTSAFFGKHVQVVKGAVIPPNVPSAPYPAPVPYYLGQRNLRGLFKIDRSVQHPKG